MVEADVNLVHVKDLRVGKYVVIDGEPCRVVSIETSKTGKHGSMIARVEALSLHTGTKRTLLKPVDASCEVPIIMKKNAQVVAHMGGNRYQLMDLETYEMSEIEVPPEFLNQVQAGKEVEIQEVMGKKMLTRVK